MRSTFFNFIKWRNALQSESMLHSMAIGMNSTVDQIANIHIIMLDYDIHDIEKVRFSVKELQDFWNLSSADIYRTRNGHHVFFWYDQIPYERLKMIIDFARYVDPMYKYISKFYTHKTIRVSRKYRLRDIFYVESIPGTRTHSSDEQSLGDLKKLEHSSFINS